MTNNGPSTTPVTANAVVPKGTKVTTHSGGTDKKGTLIWTDPSLASGASVTYKATFTVTASTASRETIGAVAESPLPDPPFSNNTVEAPITIG